LHTVRNGRICERRGLMGIRALSTSRALWQWHVRGMAWKDVMSDDNIASVRASCPLRDGAVWPSDGAYARRTRPACRSQKLVPVPTNPCYWPTTHGPHYIDHGLPTLPASHRVLYYALARTMGLDTTEYHDRSRERSRPDAPHVRSSVERATRSCVRPYVSQSAS